MVLEAGPEDLPWPDDVKSRESGVAVCALRLGEAAKRALPVGAGGEDQGLVGWLGGWLRSHKKRQ